MATTTAVTTETWTIEVETIDGTTFCQTLEMKGGQDVDWYKNRLCDVLDWRFGRDAAYVHFSMRRPTTTP